MRSEDREVNPEHMRIGLVRERAVPRQLELEPSNHKVGRRPVDGLKVKGYPLGGATFHEFLGSCVVAERILWIDLFVPFPAKDVVHPPLFARGRLWHKQDDF